MDVFAVNIAIVLGRVNHSTRWCMCGLGAGVGRTLHTQHIRRTIEQHYEFATALRVREAVPGAWGVN